MTDPLAQRLARRTLELIDIASESRDEQRIAGHVAELLRDGGVPVRDAGDGCVLAGVTAPRDAPLILFAGHFDTVPAQANRPGRIDAGTVHGLGACDMKGSLAVMIELALDRARTADGGALDAVYVFFPREELPPADSALAPLLAREPGLREAALAIVMEPTAGAPQAGCLGNVNASWVFHGRSGHSARPWLADNAIHRLGAGIARIAALEPVEHELHGLRFSEVLSATRVAGGLADNVIPDEAGAHLNYRYPPGVSPDEAERRLRELCGPDGELEILGNAPSGAVPAPSAPLERLLGLIGRPLEPKQAWTPVAELGAAGVDAINFGPGDPAHAHTRDEQVDTAALVTSHQLLSAFLGGS